ncbi:MAG: hypothetical protein K9K64_06575 [Desulfohalobiaceae bacterium]|nr:hypothetical protein [Desulfohalobiaceae bacterium]
MLKREHPWLDTNDSFPDLSLETVGQGTMHLPGYLSGGYGVFLVYRGHW